MIIILNIYLNFYISKKINISNIINILLKNNINLKLTEEENFNKITFREYKNMCDFILEIHNHINLAAIVCGFLYLYNTKTVEVLLFHNDQSSNLVRLIFVNFELVLSYR